MQREDGKVAPDGGWGWVVTFSVSFIYFVSFGITAIGGLLMLALTSEIFPEDRNKAIWIPVLCNGISRFLAPISIYLSMKSSYRTVIFTGGILISLGLALSFSATSFNLLFAYFGVTVGIGVSFCGYPSAILTNLYFDKHASLANGIFCAGQALGCLIFPLCLDFTLKLVGIRATFLCLGGMSLQICIAAALCQPVEWHMKKGKETELQTEAKTSSSLSFFTNSSFYFLSLGCTAMYFTLCTYSIIIPEFALAQVPHTYSLERTAYLLSGIAAGDFVTRSMFSWFFDLSFVNRTYCYFGGNFLYGLSVVATIFVPNYLSLLIVCVCNGVTSGICCVLVVVAYKENLGENCFGLAITVSSLVGGLLAVLVGSSVGFLRELTGSYDVAFIIIGGYQLCGVFIWVFSRLCAKGNK